MIKKKPETSGISLVLFSFFLISLFLETMSTVMAADTSASKIIVDGEEILLPGSSEKNITYLQILQKPNDLDLNLKYAQQQGKIGNYKQTIATLERLNMIYPDNVEIKLYLLYTFLLSLFHSKYFEYLNINLVQKSFVLMLLAFNPFLYL